MFAVPGWSLSSSALKTQSSATVTQEKSEILTIPGSEGKTKSSKKRKRKDARAQDVNATNLAEMWGSVIERQHSREKDATSEKRTTIPVTPGSGNDGGKEVTPQEATASTMPNVRPADNALAAAVQFSKSKTPREEQREKKREKRRKLQEVVTDTPEQIIQAPAKRTQPTSQSSSSLAKLTPLQASMRQKLVSARFRHLNQTLYTTPSKHSLNLFQENPEMFREYHEGFRRQVEIWPENPVDGYIALIKARGQQRGQVRGSGAENDADNKGHLPLPRTQGMCRVADLGCGDAGIAHGLEKEKKKLKIEVFSFDLQSSNSLVTKADIANLPLEDNSVDVAVFCLALMGTNWVDFVEEAFRVLRWKGELWVAEIKSRFGRVGSKSGKKVVEHSVGNRKKLNKKDAQKMEDATNEANLLVEVDGHDSPQETDVSAFVEVLSKRGFVLQTEHAVDLSNRMFVKMLFVKAQTPIKGKCVPAPKGMDKLGIGKETWQKKQPKKFIQEEDEHISSEASVLKPCVYKIR